MAKLMQNSQTKADKKEWNIRVNQSACNKMIQEISDNPQNYGYKEKIQILKQYLCFQVHKIAGKLNLDTDTTQDLSFMITDFCENYYDNCIQPVNYHFVDEEEDEDF